MANRIDVAASSSSGSSRTGAGVSPTGTPAAAAVRAAALDDTTFSSAVSRHLQIPNGLDGAEHSRYRALIERYFTPQAMAEFEPLCRQAARESVEAMPRGEAFEAVSDLGYRFAVAAQSAWLGWPSSMADELVAWVRSNQEATRSGDRERTAAVALQVLRLGPMLY